MIDPRDFILPDGTAMPIDRSPSPYWNNESGAVSGRECGEPSREVANARQPVIGFPRGGCNSPARASRRSIEGADPMGVLAVMDRLNEVVYGDYMGTDGDLTDDGLIQRGERAREAVAELIASDVALDAIDAELPCAPEDMPDPVAYIRRRDAAYKRRAAALARMVANP